MTRRISRMAILLALGLVLNIAVQTFSIVGMKIDFIVVMLAISILESQSLKDALLSGISFGILCALTTTFPNGQVANIVDKLILSITLYYFKEIFINIMDNKYILVTYAAFATLLSGTIFLYIALSLSNTLNLFIPLFTSVVIPSLLGNCIMMLSLRRIYL